MNYLLAIYSKDGAIMSGVKKNTPKMYNEMLALAKNYSITFKQEYKVKRVIPIKNGYKTI